MITKSAVVFALILAAASFAIQVGGLDIGPVLTGIAGR